MVKPHFCTKMIIKNQIFKIFVSELFYMVQDISLHVRMRFSDFKFKNMDFRPEKPHFSEFLPIYAKWCFSLTTLLLLLASPLPFNFLNWVCCYHVVHCLGQKRSELLFLIRPLFFGKIAKCKIAREKSDSFHVLQFCIKIKT